MSLRRKSWYLLAYDVRCSRRMRKLYQLLIDHGVPVQLSVFLIETSPSGIKQLLVECQAILALEEDDLMIYQTDLPGTIWRYGVGDDLPVWQLGKLNRRGVVMGDKAIKPMNSIKRLTRKLLWKG